MGEMYVTLIWRRPGLRVPQATHQDLAVDLQVQHQVMLIFIESMAKVEHEESSFWKGGSRPASGKSLALAAWDPLQEVSRLIWTPKYGTVPLEHGAAFNRI